MMNIITDNNKYENKYLLIKLDNVLQTHERTESG